MAVSSAQSRQVAERYARALFALAHEKDALDEVRQELDAVIQLVSESPVFAKLISSPVYSRVTQAQGVEAVLKTAKFSALTRQFFQVLAGNRRLAILSSIVVAYRHLLAESRNEGIAEIVVAHALSSAQEKHLKEALKKATGHTSVQLDVKEDANILGGMIVTIDGKMLDNSLATKLNKIAASMKA